MAILKGQAAQPVDYALRLPAQKRMTLPASQRLSTITEGANQGASRAGGDNFQPRSILRNSSSNPATPRTSTNIKRWSAGASSRRTSYTEPPPAYDWIEEGPAPEEEDEGATTPVRDEKLDALRRGEGPNTRPPPRALRGGWVRLALIVGLVLIGLVGLAVGLGVGLTRRKQQSGNNSQSQSSGGANSSSGPVQSFPLGEYSMVTALKQVQANCTANQATWHCYPNSIFDPSNGDTNSSSLATFNWIITQDSAKYATQNNTPSTPGSGIPSGLTVSTANNPFAITFSNVSMTYIASPSNATSPRYTFNFTMAKSVIPSPAITSNNAAAECFFNETAFIGTLYLSAPRNYPSGSLATSSAVASYAQWPYAVEISQMAFGGQNVPNCYETVNGAVGNRILVGLVPQPVDTECLCEYRNY